tara:strand:- start:515 stop:655 length:141 start_codon:yes stop_codon:yes gene_type:complete
MKIYGNEYADYIEEILKRLEEDQLKKGKSQFGTDQEDEGTCKTQDE